MVERGGGWSDGGWRKGRGGQVGDGETWEEGIVGVGVEWRKEKGRGWGVRVGSGNSTSGPCVFSFCVRVRGCLSGLTAETVQHFSLTLFTL